MTISLETSRADFVGNGSTALYSFTFKIFEDADLLVTTRNTSDVETTLVLTTDYTVSGAGDDEGGSITLVAGNLTSGYALTIRRVVDVVQETDIRNQGSFFPETHEDAFDYLTMIDQQQQDSIDRSIKTAETDTTTGLTLPAAADRANQYFTFDSSGNATVSANIDLSAYAVSAYMQTLLDDSSAAVARATLGFTGAAGTVAAAQLAADSVITAKILDANVTRAKLATGAVAPVSITATKTTAYTALITNDFIPCDASSAAFTVALPAASTATGHRLWIQKIDSSVNAVTIDGDASETINGSTTIKLASQYEIVQIYCNGTAWFIVARDYPRTTTLATVTFDGCGTTTSHDVRYQRIGDRMYCQGEALCGTVAASTFAINLPTGLTIDTAKITSSTGAQLVGNLHRITNSAIAYPATSTGPFHLFYDGSTSGKIFLAITAGAVAFTFTKVLGSTCFSNSDQMTFQFNVPITNWE